ncbi:MAG: diguanylate cyclase (GGDEF)-like protein/PAS domain S-box-containing protein [Oceanospirillaceae bacterium]|jgi:diguanylate cyclase (GGDEF)-like protein/PAS domain S-box-containing protein
MHNNQFDLSVGLLDVGEPLLKIFDVSPIAMALSFPNGGFEYVNPAFINLLGYSTEEVYAQGVTVTHPDDLIVNAELRLKLKTDPFTPVCIEKRYIHKQGHVIHGLLTIVAQADESCGIKRFIAQIIDVSQQKKVFEELRLAALVYENCSEAMAVTDADNVIISVNPAFTHVTGYSSAESLGRNMSMLSSGKHDRYFYANIWKSLLTTGNWQGEIWNKRKNGEVFAEKLIINTEFDAKGCVVRRVALFSDISEKKKAENLILKHANYDSLTGLPNRRLFMERLQKEVQLAKQDDNFGALLFIDLDRFKEVNDSLGHDQGDQLLVKAAQRLTHCVNESDTVARFSGDEFTIILNSLCDQINVETVVQKILKCMSTPYQLEQHKVYISASIGITLFPIDASDVGELLSNADQAMYVAKKNGRNCFHYFTECMQIKAQKRLQLISDLHNAIEKKQFELYYQPIVQMHDRRIVKAEALIRWHHPEQGLVMPDNFIAAVEESGMIIELGNWVFKQACQQLKYWRQKGFDDLQLSINTSPLQFKADGIKPILWAQELPDKVGQKLSIALEITENFLLEKSGEVREKVSQLQSLGFGLAIDDFGTGYSSISYLKELNGNYLKIDRSFVKNISDVSNDLVLCEAIIAMAHKLGVKVIAEGIETQEQYQLLCDAGCDFGQGWLFSKAVPAANFIELLNKQLISDEVNCDEVPSMK